MSGGRRVGRRDVLKTAAGALAGAGLVGTAAGDEQEYTDDHDTDTDVAVDVAYFGDEADMPRYSLEISGATDIDGMYGINVDEDGDHRTPERVDTYAFDDPQDEGYRWEWADVFDELADTADFPVAALPVDGDTVYSVFDMDTITDSITDEEPEQYGDVSDEHIYSLPDHALVEEGTPEDAVLTYLHEDEQIDLDDLHFELVYFGEDSDHPHGIAVTYPQPVTETAEPGIESIGLYSLDINDFTGEPVQNTAHVEPTNHAHTRISALKSSDTYQDIIDDGRFTVVQVIPETGDNAYGVFDMDTIDFDQPDSGIPYEEQSYQLDDHEKTVTPTPQGAVTHYLSEIGER